MPVLVTSGTVGTVGTLGVLGPLGVDGCVGVVVPAAFTVILAALLVKVATFTPVTLLFVFVTMT